MSGLLVDLFAGGGGASLGIERALGRPVDIAVNHDALAIACHERNHPATRHLQTDVWDVKPRETVGTRDVELLWASPDCRHFSRAKGGKPASKKVRSLAWVVTRWADAVRPRVIALENVQEFSTWGPLDDDGRPIKARAGETFRRWCSQLRRLGYELEWHLLTACDYGVPTSRRRLFLVARCDDEPVRWPAATHGPRRARPYRSAAECIDWSDLGTSIFERKRPLADATLRRIARGVVRFVLESGEPFIVGLGGRQGQSPERSVVRPYQTITTKADSAVVVPTLVQTGYGERKGQAPRSLDIHEPLGTVVGCGQKHGLVSAFLARHYGGMTGADLRPPLPTVTAVDHHGLVAADLAHGEHAREVAAFLVAYYGSERDGQGARDPLRTITTRDRLGLVTVEVGGVPHVITDLRLRMLQPRELARAQGFPDSYVIEGSKRDQVRLVGNSVCPPVAQAIVRSNLVAGGVVRARQGELFAGAAS